MPRFDFLEKEIEQNGKVCYNSVGENLRKYAGA